MGQTIYKLVQDFFHQQYWLGLVGGPSPNFSEKYESFWSNWEKNNSELEKTQRWILASNKFSGEGSGPRLPTKNNQYINVSSTDHYEMMERMFQTIKSNFL